MTTYYRWENRRRDKVEGGRSAVGALEVLDKFDLAPGKCTPLDTERCEVLLLRAAWAWTGSLGNALVLTV
jgi:hypothetical protein